MSERRPATPRPAPLRVALLGSGGSIGRQAVDVLVGLGDAVRVVALATGHQGELLETQARLLRPAVVALPGDPAAAARLDLPAGTALEVGPDALETLATRDDVDLVVVGTGGIVSLRPVLAALGAGKVVATANKETLVAGGHLVMPLARRRAAAVAATDPADPLASPLAWLRPIDSEHSAIWQSLAGEDPAAIARLILTASGGPFLDATPGGAGRGHPGARPAPPDLVDGGQDHDRLGDPGQQGPGGHRGALAVRCRVRRDRRRHPSTERRPLGRPVRRRLAEGAARNPGHAPPDPVRRDLSDPPPIAGHAAGPRGHRTARLPRARRDPLPGAPDRPRRRPDRVAGDGRPDRRGRGRGRPLPRRRRSTSRGSPGRSRPRWNGSGRAPTRRPGWTS